MKWLSSFLLCVLLLCSCSGVSPEKQIANSVINNVTALEKSLPSECKSDGIIASIRAIKSEINDIVVACDTDKDVLRVKIEKLKAIIASLLGVIFGILLFFLKK